MIPCFFVFPVFLYSRFRSFPTHLFLLEHIEGTEKYSSMTRQSCAVPVSSRHHYPSLWFLLYCCASGRLFSFSPPSLSVTIVVLVQSSLERTRRPWSGCACSGAAGKQQPDFARVSFVPLVVERKGAFWSLVSLSLYCSLYRHAVPSRTH